MAWVKKQDFLCLVGRHFWVRFQPPVGSGVNLCFHCGKRDE